MSEIHVAPDATPTGPDLPWGKIALAGLGAAILITPAAPGAIAVWGLLGCWCWFSREGNPLR